VWTDIAIWISSCSRTFTAQQSNNTSTQLYLASRAGTARELFEETGIDIRQSLDRLHPVILRATTPQTNKHGDESLPNEFKNRLIFVVQVTDQDYFEVRNRKNAVMPRKMLLYFSP
jgi:hypothetical protein